jgi:hypothetical protein
MAGVDQQRGREHGLPWQGTHVTATAGNQAIDQLLLGRATHDRPEHGTISLGRSGGEVQLVEGRKGLEASRTT